MKTKRYKTPEARRKARISANIGTVLMIIGFSSRAIPSPYIWIAVGLLVSVMVPLWLWDRKTGKQDAAFKIPPPPTAPPAS